MKNNNSQFILLIILFQCFIGFAQDIVITGVVTDVNKVPLPGASIIEKGTKNGAMTNMDGEYSIELKNDDAILVFHYIGFKTIEYSTTGKNVIDVVMVVDSEALDEVVITTGIRAAQRSAIDLKRNATNVIEAITPEDIGSFSDSNVADALQRVASVQIERNVDDVSGDRVSIRGLGPQFVKVTMNGRVPISGGNEGKSDFRKFNLNVIPTEIISRAKIHMTSQAKHTSTSLGGTVDFETLKPLDKKYKKGKNYFASLNVRASADSEFKDIESTYNASPNYRVNAAFGGKLNDNLGAIVSVINSDEAYAKQSSTFRGYRFVDLQEDSNNDGVFNVDDGDQLYEDVLTPATINNVYMNGVRRRLALATAIQWKVNDNLEFIGDYVLTRLNSDSDRQMFQMSLAPGGANGLFGANNFFSPGSIDFNGNNLLYIDGAGSQLNGANIQNKNQFYDNHATNNIAGLRTKFKASDKLKIDIDMAYSNLNFFQNLTQITTRLNGSDYDKDSFSIDLRGELPQYSIPDEAFDSSLLTLRPTARRLIRTKGDNFSSKLDFEYKLSNKTDLFVGSRIATTEFEAREASLNYSNYTTEQEESIIALIGDNLTSDGFMYGDIGLSQWLYTPGREVLNLTPDFANLDGGSAFDFETPLSEVESDEDNLQLSRSRSYGAREMSFANYAQVDTKVTVFNIPTYVNFGVRVIKTDNTSWGFSAVSQFDPLTEDDVSDVELNGALYHEVDNSRWDVLPSFTANFDLRENIKYRWSISRGIARPAYRNLIPNASIRFLDPSSEIFDPSSPNYVSDLGSSTIRGTITTGNPYITPYSAWMFDNTLGVYTKNGGSFTGSVFYKRLIDYIGRETLINQAYPGEEELGVAIPAGQEDLLFDISKTINITNAQLYGFAIGFNQHFTFLPGFASGFGLRANYSYVGSNFDDAYGDATNGLPGSSKHSFNSVLYYQKYGFSFRFAAAYRSNYLSNLGGVGNTRADEAHYTEGTTRLGMNLKYKFTKALTVSVSVSDLTGEDNRRYIENDTNNLNSYYRNNPNWTLGLRLKI
ncbi:TonB-dependent receptor [Winogradskyella eckloniae]|uniref:TonB-dependent receptor n=1 Tax=Winogradskyella eckloniae TaxID=1089306 RepID=UPI00156496C5|nr:TonB-dependent receptor [Winogradskyella eckloniae]NRD20711.1 TonB-dependent receptor [Winogradskyella eckloniae]